MAIARPGDFGVDGKRLNLHRTFRRRTAAAFRAQVRRPWRRSCQRQVGVLVRAPAYILAQGARACGAQRWMRRSTPSTFGKSGTVFRVAVSPNMHEMGFREGRRTKLAVSAGDIVKQLDLDQFLEAMVALAREAVTDPQMVNDPPYGTLTGKVDEVTAARNLVLR